jgi:hypothetical protein
MFSIKEPDVLNAAVAVLDEVSEALSKIAEETSSLENSV